MKKLYLSLLLIFIFSTTPALAKVSSPVAPKPPTAWKAAIPDGYTPITWAKAPGIATFFKAPAGNGSMDFLTRIYLPQNQIGFIAATNTPLDWGATMGDFNSNVASDQITLSTDGVDLSTNTSADIQSTSSFHNFAFTRFVSEVAKITVPTAQFIWNAPFFNTTLLTSDLSMAAKSTVGTTTLITSGSRPPSDMLAPRRMLIVNNQTGSAVIEDFDPILFASSSLGDQALEGFAPTVAKIDTVSGATGRLFIGVSTSSKELIIYCSQQATVQEASNALLSAGVLPEHQLEADGGGSAACGYNLPGQFFVEPTRMLPLLMGAETILARGTASTNDLNVRSGPGTKFSVVTKLPKGGVVRAFEEKNGWYRIGAGQWVLKTLIKKI